MLVGRRSAIGCLVAVVLIAAAYLVPTLSDWQIFNAGDKFPDFAPLDAYILPRAATSSSFALAIAVLVIACGQRVTAALRWPWVLLAVTLASFGWILALAAIDGRDGFIILGHASEYLPTARGIDDIGAFIAGFIDGIPRYVDNAWPVHVAGHPPGATLFFTLLDRLGLGGDLAAGITVCAIAATIPAAVLVTVRRVERASGSNEPDRARVIAPFLVLTPAALWLGVSGDAVFAASAAWAVAALAIACTARRTAVRVLMSLGSGLLFGVCAMFSYGLALTGLIALAVVLLTRQYLPMIVVLGGIFAVIGAFAVAGFVIWEAFPVLVERYYDGKAADRPWQYWIWGNLAALAICTGPAVWAALGHVGRRSALGMLVLSAVAAVLIADLTLMSKAETERIWLPFVPWISAATGFLAQRERRALLVAAAAFTLLAAHLLQPKW